MIIRTSKNNTFAFTLIEVMVVIAIIGILTSIALPLYSDYQNSSKLTAGLTEISGSKTQFELLINNGQLPTIALMTSIQNPITENCTIAVSNTTIMCTIRNGSTAVNDAKLIWTWDTVTQQWSCNSQDISGDNSLAPSICPV